MVHAIERILRQDRIIVIAGLIAITLLAWGYVINLSLQITNMAMDVSPSMDMPPTLMMPNGQAWQVEDILFTLLMWAIMMVAVMIPSAAPMILTFAGLKRQQHMKEIPISTTV